MGFTKTTTTRTTTTSGGRSNGAVEITCECNLGGITRALSFVAGLATAICGLVHVFSKFRKECPSLGRSDCVGPWLFWSSGDFTADVNGAYWRLQLFSLAPDAFIDNWSAVILGLITMFLHVHSLRIEALSRNWARLCVWFLFVALFGSFGYAGNLGVLTGFLNSLVALLCFILACGPGRNVSTTMNQDFSALCCCV